MSRRVLVTGGASGLGLALAKGFLARGDRVVVGDLARTRPGAVPADAAYVPLDVRQDAHWSAARTWVTERWGGLDVLVNNAGIATGGRIDVEAIEDWQRVLDINLLGVVRGARAFTPMFKEQRGGHIVNIASLAGLIHGAGMSSYNATKAGVVALSETLSFELRPWNITTSVVCPAFFRTNLHESLRGADAPMHRTAQRLITSSPTTADDVAAVVLAGIDAGRFLILTDRLGRREYWTKRLAAPLYRRTSRAGGERLARKPRRSDG